MPDRDRLRATRSGKKGIQKLSAVPRLAPQVKPRSRNLSQFSLLTDGRQSKHLIERDDKEDEQQSLHNLDKEENAQEPWEKHSHPEADSREWLNKLSQRFDVNPSGSNAPLVSLERPRPP